MSKQPSTRGRQKSSFEPLPDVTQEIKTPVNKPKRYSYQQILPRVAQLILLFLALFLLIFTIRALKRKPTASSERRKKRLATKKFHDDAKRNVIKNQATATKQEVDCVVIIFLYKHVVVNYKFHF